MPQDDNTTNKEDKAKPSLALVAGTDLFEAKPSEPKRQRKGNKIRNAHGVTEIEEAFAQAVTRGGSLADAYRAVSATEHAKPETIWRRACDWAARPHVKARIKVLMERKEADASLDAARTKAFIYERLMAEAKDRTSNPVARLKAVELLGKLSHVGAFTERSEVSTVSLSADQLEQRINDLLKQAG